MKLSEHERWKRVLHPLHKFSIQHFFEHSHESLIQRKFYVQIYFPIPNIDWFIDDSVLHFENFMHLRLTWTSFIIILFFYSKVFYPPPLGSRQLCIFKKCQKNCWNHQNQEIWKNRKIIKSRRWSNWNWSWPGKKLAKWGKKLFIWNW